MTEHGTYAAYQQHRKIQAPDCDECRAANAEYQLERRRESALARKREKQDAARRRAWTRLAQMHPTQYQALYAEELELGR